MTPLEIIVAVCLGLGPALLGPAVGVALAFAYGVACDRWDNFVMRWDEHHRFFNYSNADRTEKRQVLIAAFWAVVGLLLGGFAAGCYVEAHLGLTLLLSEVERFVC
jgi:sterol desaturase/sphingolipid hydroxylase (fatty acid hydroxylase superfamily)